MPLRTAQEYQSDLEREMKGLLSRDETLCKTFSITEEALADAFSVLVLVANHGMPLAERNALFLCACKAVIQAYSVSDIDEPQYHDLAKALCEKWQPKAMTDEASQHTIDRLIPVLECGILRSDRRVMTSSYWNLCQAIVLNSQCLQGWHFSHVFKHVLGFERLPAVDYHRMLIDLGMRLGYFKDSVEGVCRGVVMAWISDCIVHKHGRYTDLISDILEKDGDFVDTVVKTKEKVMRHAVLSLQEERVFQLLALYDEMSLYQEFCYYTDVLDRTCHQNDIEFLSQVAASAELEADGGLISPYSEVGIYNQEELAQYLKDIATSIDSVDYSRGEIMGIVISNFDHVIGLIYDTTSGVFRVLDINQNEPQAFSQSHTKEMAAMLWYGFHHSATSVPYLALHGCVITTGRDSHYSVLQEALEKLKNSHVITVDIAKRCENVNLAWMAAFFRKTQELKVLAEHEADLSVSDKKGATLAWVAAQNGDIEVLAVLIDHRVNLSAPNNNRATPAWIAAQQGHASVLTMLAEHKADLSTPNRDKVTPALIAAYRGHVAALTVLAEHKVNLDEADKDGTTPVWIAAQRGDVAVLTLLAEHGADLDLPDVRGIEPVWVAVQRGHAAALAVLAEHKANLTIVKDGITLAWIAAYRGDAATLTVLAKYKVDLNKAKEDDGVTPVFIAAQQGHAAALAVLAKNKADLSQPNKNGATPIFIAAQQGHAAALAVFARHGVRLNEPNRNGVTLAWIAAQQGHADVLAVLAQHGADLTIPLVASKGRLKQLTARCTDQIKERMERCLAAKLSEGASEACIAIKPEEIADIMGHRAVISFFIAKANESCAALLTDSVKSNEQIEDDPTSIIELFPDVTAPDLGIRSKKSHADLLSNGMKSDAQIEDGVLDHAGIMELYTVIENTFKDTKSKGIIKILATLEKVVAQPEDLNATSIVELSHTLQRIVFWVVKQNCFRSEDLYLFKSKKREEKEQFLYDYLLKKDFKLTTKALAEIQDSLVKQPVMGMRRF